MPPPKHPTRGQQPSTSGLGKTFSSPIKRRDKTKTTTYVQLMGHHEEIARLREKIQKLKKQAEVDVELPTVATEPDTGHPSVNALNALNDDTLNTPIDDPPSPTMDDLLHPLTGNIPGPEESRIPRRTKPNQAAKDLYSNWTSLLTRLITPLLEYTSKSLGKIPERGAPVQDAFRRGLGYAAQWYDNLQIRMEERIEAAVFNADKQLQRSKIYISPMTLAAQPPTQLTPGECARSLRQRCPACFGGDLFGRSLEQDGGDIHICVDGNFNHRHLRSAGDSPKFYEPTYILSKDFVDEVGARMERLRKTRKPQPRKPVVPDEAINECESSHMAGNGSNIKTNMERFDDGGLMALVCRHDIPIFLANIDTPGEQQKYAVALIEHLFSLLPPQATVSSLYDVGCMLGRSLLMYDFLSPNITKRLQFATSAMHAFVHQWACQIVNNPRIRMGLGLTDGEGVERLWSKLRKLIARSRRLYIVDRQVGSIGADLRDDLGAWIRRRLAKGVDGQGRKAQQIMESCRVEVVVLRSEWKLQQASELSIRAREFFSVLSPLLLLELLPEAPVLLKKELDHVLALQGDLESSGKTLQATRSALSKTLPTADSLRYLSRLQELQEQSKDYIEELYSSLTIQGKYPELHGVDLDFVKYLLIARDLKINVRKRAIGSFFEWERIDQASGGREQALGTKLHQATRAAIKRRMPALMAGLRKYNDICATLAAMYKPEWAVPLPEPLPTELQPLRDASSLMEDVWISRPMEEVPRWLSDKEVREGIRAMLKTDRCAEERRRLEVEAANLSRWFGRELAAVEVALIDPSTDVHVRVPLQQRRSRLLNLCSTWSTPFAPQIVFDNLIAQATQAAQSLSPPACDLHSNPLSRYLPTSAAPAHSQEQAECMDDEDFPEDHGGLMTQTTDEIMLDDYLSHTAECEVIDMMAPNIVSPGVDISLIWQLPARFNPHQYLLKELSFQALGDFAPLSESRYFPHRRGRFIFSPHELEMLSSPAARLNDVCINGIAALLKYQFSESTRITSGPSRRCAIFSTFDLSMVRYNASDDEIWRRTRHTEYWKHDIWILPIHRPSSQHWVMCTILLSCCEIHLFDSLAQHEPWNTEVKDIMSFTARLILLANKNGHLLHVITSGWTAWPSVIYPRQTNAVDCGVWVISNIAAVLLGFSVTGIEEREIPFVRNSLLQTIAALFVVQ
ncbi:hypothetical protein C0993_010997 [Termitomyces sp. T159_Od127]|nr:hypothetical protein C0993_010997 [Termitomyces sp. T159_Od127]